MKKLMTVIAAAATAFGLYAETATFADTATSVENDDNEEYALGALDLTVDNNWFSEGDLDATVTAYEEDQAPEHKNPLFADYDQKQFINLQDGTLIRTAAECETKMEQVDIKGADRDGIVFDQLVKFTAFEDAPDVSADGAKIAVWVKAVEQDEGDPVNHLMITAGKLDEMLTPETSDPIDAGEIDVEKFHQITITAIEAGKVDNLVVPGFTVAIDGKEIEYKEELFPADPSLAGGEYTAEGAKLIGDNKLFPSLVDYTTGNGGTLQGVAFKGSGAIDDISIQPTTFAPPTYDITITTPENGTLETSVTNGVAAGTEVTVTATPNGGYELVSITTNGQVLAGNTFVMPAENVTVAATFQEKAQDWDVPSGKENEPASEVFGDLPNALANVPAKNLADWAKANKIPQDATLSSADMIDAYALNCDPANLEAEKAKAEEAIKITSITYDAEKDEWVVTTAAGEDGDAYVPNGELKLIEVTGQILGADAENAKLWKMTIVPAAVK